MPEHRNTRHKEREQEKEKEKNKETVGVLRALALLVQIGLSLALPLVIMVWLGQLAGSRFGAENLFLVLSIILGLGGGLGAVIRLLVREIR